MSKNFKNKFKSYESHPMYNKSHTTTEKILKFFSYLIMGICAGVYFLFAILEVLIFSIPLIIFFIIIFGMSWYGLGKFFTLSMIFIILIVAIAMFTDVGKDDDII